MSHYKCDISQKLQFSARTTPQLPIQSHTTPSFYTLVLNFTWSFCLTKVSPLSPLPCHTKSVTFPKNNNFQHVPRLNYLYNHIPHHPFTPLYSTSQGLSAQLKFHPHVTLKV